MPRVARIKNNAGIYHIMVRSISDVALFRDTVDKDKYLQLIKKYQEIYLFKIYSYCLMTTHGHMIVDCCGADISNIMKSINQCYSAYFNKRYDRHGHVFQDRFKSKLVDDDNYLLKLSAYIHHNPKDIEEYKFKVQEYKYSSLRVYLGIALDEYKILSTDFILGHFSINITRARKSYLDFINKLSDAAEKIDVEFINDGSECRSERKILIRDFVPDEIIKFISKYTDTSFDIHIKFSHKHTELKALSILVMRCLCNLSLKELCGIVGNITISTLWRLCEKGYALITENEKYKPLISDILSEFSN